MGVVVGGVGNGAKSFLTLSLFSHNRLTLSKRFPVFLRPLCSSPSPVPTLDPTAVEPLKRSILLERLRIRHLKDSSATPNRTLSAPPPPPTAAADKDPIDDGGQTERNAKANVFESFEELGLSEEIMGAVSEIGISVPTEIQGVGIPAVLNGKSVVLGSHTGSGKTLAYLLPLVQLMRRDEEIYGMIMKPRRPRAVVMCPTRELSDQVFRVAKSISHHARFRSIMVSGGGRARPQEDLLNGAIDMVVGTPGRILQHIEEGNIVYGDIKYVVLDEADTMFDQGFGPDIRKFIAPLKNRKEKLNGLGFQAVMVTATMTGAVQKLVDEEFQGIEHLRTSSLHKKISTARHDFVKISGSENKLEALQQVLEPSLAKGNKVMVFCNTLNSSRAVDHYLSENGISTVNYHGEVPAAQRVENLKKFKTEEGDCPTLVCTDLAARGLDLDVDHVIMFDFPSTSIDYLHRTGRTARMGAKGKVTSLVTRKDVMLATQIEEAMRKNESLESISRNSLQNDIARTKITQQKVKIEKYRRLTKLESQTKQESASLENTKRAHSTPTKSARPGIKVSRPAKAFSSSGSRKTSFGEKKQSWSEKPSSPSSSRKPSFGQKKESRSPRPSSSTGPKKPSFGENKQSGSNKFSSEKPSGSKLKVVGFRGKSGWSGKKVPAMSR